jgi:hypothetical protein
MRHLDEALLSRSRALAARGRAIVTPSPLNVENPQGVRPGSTGEIPRKRSLRGHPTSQSARMLAIHQRLHTVQVLAFLPDARTARINADES